MSFLPGFVPKVFPHQHLTCQVCYSKPLELRIDFYYCGALLMLVYMLICDEVVLHVSAYT